MGSWDERIRSESAYLRPQRGMNVCVNTNTDIVYRQVYVYSLIQNLKNPTGQKMSGFFFRYISNKKLILVYPFLFFFGGVGV